MTPDETRRGGPPPSPTPLRVDDLVVDLEQRAVWRDAQAVELTDLSFRLFAALIRHAPEQVSKDKLIEEVWDGAVVSDETLAQRVRLLRQSLGDDSQNPRYVAAVRGRGYRLVAVPSAVPPAVERRAPSPWLLAVAALLLGVAAAWLISHSSSPDAAGADAGVLAVLPFADLGADQGADSQGRRDYQFFADGMHEELLSQLAMIDDLAVISRTSVERYRGSELSLPAVAQRLGADAVVEGSVRIDGDRLRVTVQLIDAASDEHLWAANFDRSLSVQDIFALQSEVASQIAGALRLEFPDSASRSPRLPTSSLEAYNLYLMGRYHTFKQTRYDLTQAVSRLEQAISIDPEFAQAYAALGWAYSFLGSEYGSELPAQMYPQAKEAALRAIALDAGLSDARTLYADILTWYDWDFAAAEREYLKTVELDPLNVLGYALFLSTQGRHEEAIALVERRLAAQPADPYVRINAGWRYFHARRLEQAVDAAVAAADHPDSDSLLGWSRLAQDDTAAAVDVFEAALASSGRTPRNVGNLAAAYFRDGNRRDAEPLLAELLRLAQTQHVSPGLIAAVHFSAGDADAGFEWLERAFEQRSRDMIFLAVTESLRGYRDDPRYLALVRRVGLQ